MLNNTNNELFNFIQNVLQDYPYNNCFNDYNIYSAKNKKKR